MPIDYSTRERLYNYRPKVKYKPSIYQRILIAYRSVVTVLGVAFHKFKPEKEDYFYDEFSDRSDDVRRWYEKRYP